MKAIRTVLACIRKADQMYNLINHGDKIMIGLSGGKDSVALTYALSLYQKFSHTDFVIQPVMLDLGFPDFNPYEMNKFCESLGLKLLVVDNTEVYRILQIQQKDKEHLPCSICSRMKKASMNKIAKEQGFSENGYRVVVNCGKDAGQEVMHLHYHLLSGMKFGGKIVCKKKENE